MKTRRTNFVFPLILLALTIAFVSPAYAQAHPVPLLEDFNGPWKDFYRKADVQLATGNWRFGETLSSAFLDEQHKSTRVARIRGYGVLQMNFDVVSAGMVTIKHAVFDNDDASSWELWASTDGGSSYFKIGDAVSKTSKRMMTAVFTVNSATPIRFSIHKESGRNTRILIDDFKITPYSGRQSRSKRRH